MRKRIMLWAAMLLFLHIPAAQAAADEPERVPFVDITGHPAEQSIAKLFEHDVVIGDGTGRFRPDDPVTRGELVVMLLAAKGIKPAAGNQSSFADVSRDSWLHPYVETAYRLGFFHGSREKDGLYFKPNDRVERQELIAMLLSARGESGRVNQVKWSTTMQTLNNYADSEQVAKWGQRPMVYALSRQLVSPLQGDTLQPLKTITRAEAAQYICDDLLVPLLKQTSYTAKEFRYKRTLTVTTTAYTYSSDGPLSYIGWPLRPGVVAVDPDVIALGTHLYIEGYGYAVAADVGGAVKNNHVDVFLPSLQAALAYGRQKDTKVYILN